MYVADQGNARVQKFTSSGDFIAAWGLFGVRQGQFKDPVAVDAFNSQVYVTGHDQRVQVFTPDGGYVTHWGTGTGFAEGQFHDPSDVSVTLGFSYVADENNHRIQMFDANGEAVLTWGSQGPGPGQFDHPVGIAVDRTSDNVYVSDRFNHRIQRFDSKGNFRGAWGNFGTGVGQFNQPRHIAVDTFGDVYVVDMGNARVQKFNSDGWFLTTWGETGSGPGQFLLPYGIAVDLNGDVYVSDMTTNRIQRFGWASASQDSTSQDVLEDPVRLSMESPRYPIYARRGVEGSVSVRCFVGKDGRVLRTKIIQGVHGLNEASVAAARTARFKPPAKPGWVTIPFKFELLETPPFVIDSPEKLVEGLAGTFRQHELFMSLLANDPDRNAEFVFLPSEPNEDGDDQWGYAEEERVHRRMFPPQDLPEGEFPLPTEVQLMRLTPLSRFNERPDFYSLNGGADGKLDPNVWRATGALYSTNCSAVIGDTDYQVNGQAEFVVVEDLAKADGEEGQFLLLRWEDILANNGVPKSEVLVLDGVRWEFTRTSWTWFKNVYR